MMVKATIRNLDNGNVNKLSISKYRTIILLRKEWSEITKFDHNKYCFMDVFGNILPEDGFVESILLPRTYRVKLHVERFVPLKIIIEGYPQFSTNINVGLSVTTETLKELICENFVLPKREMILRTKNKYLVTNKSLRQQGIDEETEIVSDFIFVIHIDGINKSVKQSTVFCYASESTWKILDAKQAINCQRLHFDEELIPIRQTIHDTLKNLGGLYQEEFSLFLECKMTVYVIHPRRSRKTKQYTVTRIVWPLDRIAVVSSENDEGDVVALWQNRLYSLNTTFLEANIMEHALFAVGIILSLNIVDKQGLRHLVYLPHTTTISELMMKINEVVPCDPYHFKMGDKWLDPYETLEESRIQSGSTLIMDAKEYEVLLYCDRQDYQLGLLKEDITFFDLLSVANNVVALKLNERTAFECKCGSMLKAHSTDGTQQLLNQHSSKCIKSSYRRFIAHRQVRIHIELDSGEKIEIVESIRTKVFKIVNAIIPEDEMGLHLVDGEKVYEKNKRLSDYISPTTEDLELKLTRPVRFSVVRHERALTYLDSMAKLLSEDGNDRPLITVTSSVDRGPICMDGSSVGQGKIKLETSSSAKDIKGHLQRIRTSIYDASVTSALTQKTSLVDLEPVNSQDNEERRSVFHKIEMNESEFFHAVENDDCSLLRILLENGVDVNCVQVDGASALYIAAQDNSVDVIKLLLFFKADINIKKSNGTTPLFIAVYENNFEAVKVLVENGADTECEVFGGITPIILAANNGNTKIVELLCLYGAQVDKDISTGATALFKAVQMNHYEIAKVLLLNGANVNMVLETGTTPLMRAVNDSFHKIARLLLEFGANINHSRVDGTTCLHISAQINDDIMTSLLISWGANLNVALVDGGTPLHIAVYHNSFEAIDVLLSSGANLNEPWLDGASPLHIAAILGSEKSAQRLLEFGADPNSKMDDGATPLFIATQENRLDLIKLFIEFQADVNITRNDGVSPIEMASKLELADAAAFLKDAGAKGNISCRTQ